jgi:hypothetical protein
MDSIHSPLILNIATLEVNFQPVVLSPNLLYLLSLFLVTEDQGSAFNLYIEYYYVFLYLNFFIHLTTLDFETFCASSDPSRCLVLQESCITAQ